MIKKRLRKFSKQKKNRQKMYEFNTVLRLQKNYYNTD